MVSVCVNCVEHKTDSDAFTSAPSNNDPNQIESQNCFCSAYSVGCVHCVCSCPNSYLFRYSIFTIQSEIVRLSIYIHKWNLSAHIYGTVAPSRSITEQKPRKNVAKSFIYVDQIKWKINIVYSMVIGFKRLAIGMSMRADNDNV